MAQKTTVQLIDDIDGSEAAETLSFSLDGVLYEIDLSEENAAALRESMAEWVGGARRLGGRQTRGRRGGRPTVRRTVDSDSSTIREWARANGYNVSSRGRISAEIRDAFAAAN